MEDHKNDPIYEQQANSTLNNYEMIGIASADDPDDNLEVEMNVSDKYSTNISNQLHTTDYNDIKAALKSTKKYMNILAFMLVMLLLMTITSTVTALAVFSCIAVRSIQPIDSKNNTVTNRSAEFVNIMNDFTSQFNQLLNETWTDISQVPTQLSEQQNLIELMKLGLTYHRF